MSGRRTAYFVGIDLRVDAARLLAEAAGRVSFQHEKIRA